MRYLILISLALSLCGCGLTVRPEAQTPPAIQLPDVKDQTIAQLQARITADQKDITAAKSEIQAKQEAHWATLAYITAGILGLGTLVFAFLAFEAPLLRGKLATGALFCGAAAAICVWIGQHIHLVLLSGPALLVAAILGTIWVMRNKTKAVADESKISTFLASEWQRYGTELSVRIPELKADLDKASLATQEAMPSIKARVDSLLHKV